MKTVFGAKKEEYFFVFYERKLELFCKVLIIRE